MTIVEELQILLDESGGSTFWTADHLYDALNYANLINWINTKRVLLATPLIVEAGSNYIDIPPEILIPQYVQDDEKKYFTTTLAKLERYSPTWKTQPAGVPQYFIRFGVEKLRPWPTPDLDYRYTLVGLGWPTELSSTNDDLTAPALCRQAIVYRAASSLMEFTNPNLADVFANEAEDAEHKHTLQHRNHFSHNIRSIRPANRFNRQQSGNILPSSF